MVMQINHSMFLHEITSLTSRATSILRIKQFKEFNLIAAYDTDFFPPVAFPNTTSNYELSMTVVRNW